MVGRDHTYFLCSFPQRELGNVAKPWYSSPAGGTLSLFRFPQFHLNPLVKPTREMEIYNHCVYDCVCVCVCVWWVVACLNLCNFIPRVGL